MAPTKWPKPIARLFEWLEPEASRAAFEPPPGVSRVDLYVAALLVPVALFSALVFAAPLLLPAASTGDLSGRVGTIDNAGVWSAFPEPVQWIYRVGDVACHTKSMRSFELNGNQMPFCARDIAIFAGAVAGLAACLSPRLRTYRAVVVLPWWSYLALLAPVAVDGGAQDFLGFESDNVRRLLTGFPAGLAVAFALVFIAYEGHFASARSKRRRLDRRRRADAPGQGAEAAASGSTGSRGSNAVESAPTEKKNKLRP